MVDAEQRDAVVFEPFPRCIKFLADPTRPQNNPDAERRQLCQLRCGAWNAPCNLRINLSGDDAGVVKVNGNGKMFVIVHNAIIKKGKEWERQSYKSIVVTHG